MCQWINSTICVTIILNYLIFTESIKLVSVSVPQVVQPGSSVNISCDYQLENDQLYSLKWYHNVSPQNSLKSV